LLAGGFVLFPFGNGAAGDPRRLADYTIESKQQMSDINQAREIPIEIDEIEAAEKAARAGPVEAATFDPQGRLLRTVITTKDFLAGNDAFEYINGLEKGSVFNLGTLAGEIYSVDKKSSEYKGAELTSYWLNGVFQAVVAETGEVFQAGQAILPKSYGVQVYNAFKDLGVSNVTLGATIGLRLSGRTGIPYEWVVRDHMAQASTTRVAAISDKLGTLLGIAGSAAIPAPQKKIASK
jgi:hypothetical protein